jgi:ribosomal silencing factor RsfS
MITSNSPEMKDFLLRLIVNGGSSSRKTLPIADRTQDKVRTKAKLLGWAKYEAGRWHITDLGRNAFKHWAEA